MKDCFQILNVFFRQFLKFKALFKEPGELIKKISFKIEQFLRSEMNLSPFEAFLVLRNLLKESQVHFENFLIVEGLL